MTLHFHTYQEDGIEYLPGPIYRRDLDAYKRDSKRNVEGYWRRKYAHIKNRRNTVTQMTMLLAIGTIGLSAYAAFA